MLHTMHHLVGAQEIGEMFGVGRARVYQLTQHPTFPKPVAVLGMGKVWHTEDVRRWAQERGREIHNDRRQP